jgi:hypothetical protein
MMLSDGVVAPIVLLLSLAVQGAEDHDFDRRGSGLTQFQSLKTCWFCID